MLSSIRIIALNLDFHLRVVDMFDVLHPSTVSRRYFRSLFLNQLPMRKKENVQRRMIPIPTRGRMRLMTAAFIVVLLFLFFPKKRTGVQKRLSFGSPALGVS